ncbi:MAG: MBL fold metallo-hydrolase, partial [Myxococcales bacterium]|nr:MBL fold metallo-hydrolase [Myxococcales bacterium]
MLARAALALCLGLGSLLGACATPRADTSAPTSDADVATTPAPAGTWERLPQAPRVGRYVSSPWGFSTVSYWIEGPQGVVLVDTQFLPSAAEELVAVAEQQTGKPVVAAVVLHANPDKFNGTATLQARGIEVLTSDQVLAKIPEIHAIRVEAFGERYAPDYPTALPQPEGFGDTSTTLHLAGLQLRAHVLGPGCSGAHVALEWEGHLFVGDLVANGAHSWMELGLSDQWLARIDELQALGATHVHPGRGAWGGPELLTAQGEYLRRVQTLVAAEHAALHGRGEPSEAEVDEALARVRQTLEQEHPGYRYGVFLAI